MRCEICGRDLNAIWSDNMRDRREWLAVVSEKGRNMRTVWKIGTVGIKEAHFSTFLLELARRCVEAGCPKDGTVLDLFMGSGTTNIASAKLGIKSIGIELMKDNIEIAKKRIAREVEESGKNVEM